jgi:hypothetical protein
MYNMNIAIVEASLLDLELGPASLLVDLTDHRSPLPFDTYLPYCI